MATSLLKRGQDAIVIFTYGKYFRKMKDGSGSTGNWVIDEKRKCNRVVIYNRTERGNEVYVAQRKAVIPSKESGRFVIQLDDIQYFGSTYFNWPQFSGSRNPVRYFKMSGARNSRPRGNGGGESAINLELLPAVANPNRLQPTPMLPTNTHILFPEFEYHAPTTISEVTELLAQYGEDARVMAGGTDLLVQMKMERRQPAHVISLQRISALRTIAQNGSLTIGAATSIRALYNQLSSPAQSLISNRDALYRPNPPNSNPPSSSPPFNALSQACSSFSTVQIMYMATLGGNLCNASPAADTAPCLLVFDATVTLKSKTRERVISLKDFFLAPGRTDLGSNELLTHVHIPGPAPGSGSAFMKMSRVAADISQVCAAVYLVRECNVVRDARIALGSVAPVPLRVANAAAALVGQPFSRELAAEAGEIAVQEISPISDVRATREYRQHVAAVIVRDALLQAWGTSSTKRNQV